MNSEFEIDLRESCGNTSYFLRKKHPRYNDAGELKRKDRLYSVEREFLAELYRLLICNDASDREKLFFEAIRPDSGEESRKMTPDLVYRNGNLEKCVIEVNAPVNNRAKGSEVPYKSDINDIESYYEKLEKNYNQFDSKFLLVAYLGDTILESGDEFSLEDFEKFVKANS